MPVVRQLPVLLLRGSLANETMRFMPQETQEEVNGYLNKLRNHPEIKKQKLKAYKEFKKTLRGAFEELESAEQEVDIALWRGIVNIKVHRDYSYRCAACLASAYYTKRGKPKAIDRRDVPCPNCRYAKVDNPGATDLAVGALINHDDAQTLYQNMPYGAPTFVSCIESTAGAPKYDKSDILESDSQLKKFFGEFVFNYFRQQVKENKRKTSKHVQTITGFAHEIAEEEIRDLCVKHNVPFTINHSSDNVIINVKGLLTSPDFSAGLNIIKVNTLERDICLTINDFDITIEVAKEKLHVMIVDNQYAHAEIIPAKLFTTTITRPTHITMIENRESSDGEEGFDISQLGGDEMTDDHVTSIDMQDAFLRTRNALPEGNCRKVYDILSQSGENYILYSEIYGEGPPKINHVAKWLGITPRTVKQHKETITVCCMANDFVPKLADKIS